VYRLYEIVQNYGYAYKAVLNEKFGDGIMSAISFSTKVEKETDDKGDWVKITLRGKWYVYCSWVNTRASLLTRSQASLLALLDDVDIEECTYAGIPTLLQRSRSVLGCQVEEQNLKQAGG